MSPFESLQTLSDPSFVGVGLLALEVALCIFLLGRLLTFVALPEGEPDEPGADRISERAR